jgi:hypothetical protein
MKKIALFLLCSSLFAVFSSFGQNNENKTSKGQIGITFSTFGKNDLYRPQYPPPGAASITGDKYFTVGIDYLYPIFRILDIETGIEYSNQKVIISPNLPPNMDRTPYGAKFSMINIPAILRLNFLKFCFINAGLNLATDASVSNPIDSQTGIGGIMGLGLHYEFKCGVSAFVNPYSKFYSLVSFSPKEDRQKLMESGFRFGLLYKLK